jgi:hypothetical protein
LSTCGARGRLSPYPYVSNILLRRAALSRIFAEIAESPILAIALCGLAGRDGGLTRLTTTDDYARTRLLPAQLDNACRIKF